MIEDVGRHSGKYKYQDSGVLISFAIMFVSLMLVMMHLFTVDPEDDWFYQFWVYIGVFWGVSILFLVFYIWVVPMKIQLQKQEACDNVKVFIEGPWDKGKGDSDEFFAGVERVWELEIDFHDPNGLQELMSSEIYESYLRTLKRQISIGDFQATKSVKDEKDALKRIKKKYDLIEKKRKKAKKAAEKTKKENEDDEGENEDEGFPEKALAKEIEQQKKRSLDPYNHIEFDWLMGRITKENLNFLNSLHYYFVIFYDKEKWRNTDIEIDSSIYIMREPWDSALNGEPGIGYHDGWEVNVNKCDIHNQVVSWVLSTMPVLWLAYSKPLAEIQLDFMENMNSEVLIYLNLRLFEMWINHLRVQAEQARKHIAAAEARAEGFKKDFAALLVQRLTDMIELGPFIKDSATRELVNDTLKAKYKSKALSVVVGVLIIIVLILILAFSGVFAPSEDPVELALFLSLFLNLL